MGEWHPECPRRLDAINDQLIASGLLGFLEEKQAEPASREQVLRVHTPQYLQYLHAHAPESGYFFIDPDTGMNPHRSEEHTSELQSLMRISYAVFCLKKKNKKTTNNNTLQHI